MTSLPDEMRWVKGLEVKVGESQLIRTKTGLEEDGVTLSKSTAPWQTARHQSNQKLHPVELKRIKDKCHGPL